MQHILIIRKTNNHILFYMYALICMYDCTYTHGGTTHGTHMYNTIHTAHTHRLTSFCCWCGAAVVGYVKLPEEAPDEVSESLLS